MFNDMPGTSSYHMVTVGLTDSYSQMDSSLLLLASAWTVLNHRDEVKPRKQQAPHDLTAPELTTLLEQAKKQRSDLSSQLKTMQDKAYQVMPTMEAQLCLSHAAVACRMETGPLVPGAFCCFSSTKTRVHLIQLFGNTVPGTPATGTKQQRMEASFHVSEPWLSWVRAVIVACNSLEWMDQLTAQWLDANPTAQLTNKQAHALAQSLAPHFKSLELACKIVPVPYMIEKS